jgi:RHS repeat-associated protein
LRYRGYYYDTETGFYYLQSRYYDPVIGRFINADSQLNGSKGFLGYNMFAYSLNNPVNMLDHGGNKPGDLFDTMDGAARDAAIYMGLLSWENEWEYAVSFYCVTETVTITTTYINPNSFGANIFSWLWNALFGGGMTRTTTKRVKVTKYTYTEAKTDKDGWRVTAPSVPWYKERVGDIHTHPFGSGKGKTWFSIDDKAWADEYKIPIYVHGPNGEMRKYDPSTGEDISIFTDLPVSPYTPWK